jgi:NAD(P)-dependent dehydrogenase (short-subunit alcohol dehydrogenase family)
LLAERGATVLVNDVGAGVDGLGSSETPAEDVVREITSKGGQAAANHDSVAEPDGPATMVADAIDRFGRLDIVVNNAGFALGIPFDEHTMAQVRQLFDVHVFGTIGVTLAAWPHLVTSGSGRVVNTTSPAIFGMVSNAVYSAAKGAILAFTKNVAHDGEPHGMKVNAISPAASTRMVEESDTPEEVKVFMRDHLPPSLVSPAVAFLAHESCPFNGEAIAVAGGRVARLGFFENEGFVGDPLTVEAIRDNLDVVMDPSTVRIIERVEYAVDR